MPSVARSDKSAARASQSAISSLKAIFSILMGLSVTNTLVILIREDGNPSVGALASIDPLHAMFAAVLLFSIARFYLGNVRHIDDFYVAAMVDGKPLDPHMNAAPRFVVDFAVLLIEALMFSLASFYIAREVNFIEILMALLAIDILWTVATRGVAPHSGLWFSNNLVHLFAIAVCFGFHLKYEVSLLPFYFAIGLLFTNGIIDFACNRAFYFADRLPEKAIFLSAPFSQLLTKDGLPAETRERLVAVIDHLEAEGWSVDNAHKRERWGTSLDSPYRAMTADLKGIDDAGIVVAILGSPPSPGVQLEIGFALARKKKLVLIADTDDPMPYLIRGVVERASVILIRSTDSHQGNYELGEAISDALKRLKAGVGTFAQ
jgi:nucleoside 2-deoxyribosyltransferase